jgi:hypothetical protein
LVSSLGRIIIIIVFACFLQAQGEAVLRKALSELKLWSLQREFTLTDNTTEWAGKIRKTPLIKVRQHSVQVDVSSR